MRKYYVLNLPDDRKYKTYKRTGKYYILYLLSSGEFKIYNMRRKWQLSRVYQH